MLKFTPFLVPNGSRTEAEGCGEVRKILEDRGSEVKKGRLRLVQGWWYRIAPVYQALWTCHGTPTTKYYKPSTAHNVT